MEGNLPPGFRFHPTDEELITYYLNRKVSDFRFVARAIADVDLNKCEPWDLPAKASMGEKEWYFFSLRDRKYPTGLRTNRATDAGYWKTTGKDKEIFKSGVLVGMKKTLVFYKGRAPKGEKTNWVMHEYRHQHKFSYRTTKEEWVVCRVFRKSSNGKRPQGSTPSLPSLLESPCNTTSLSDIGELDVSVFNNIVNNSSSFEAAEHATRDNDNNNGNNGNNSNSKADTNISTNWFEAMSSTALPWPSSLLGSNFSPYTGIPKPMQFNANIASLGSFMAQDPFNASSSKASDAAVQPQQPFDSEVIWRGSY